MRNIVLALALVLALGGCAAGFSRALSYGNRFADARFDLAGQEYTAWVHPTDSTIMLQNGYGAAVGAGVADGLGVGVDAKFDQWRAAAERLVAPTGCSVENLRPLDQAIMWEFDYRCPDGVDLRAMIMAQRDELRDGALIRSPQLPAR